VLYGTFPGTSGSLTMSKVGVFTASGTTVVTSTTFTLAANNVRVGAGQTITGSGIPAGTTVVSVVGTAVTMSAAATASATITATFDNNIAVSGGCVVIHPYLFVYGNNGLIQNSSAGDFSNWVSPDANANNVATGKIVKGLPIRGGSTSPSGLFWAADALIRVSFQPSTVGGVNYYWGYDLSEQPDLHHVVKQRDRVRRHLLLGWRGPFPDVQRRGSRSPTTTTRTTFSTTSTLRSAKRSGVPRSRAGARSGGSIRAAMPPSATTP
jgi:hypothetical protein